jgi:hypothetical protein
MPVRSMSIVVGIILLMVNNGYSTDSENKYAVYGFGFKRCSEFLNTISDKEEKMANLSRSSNSNTPQGFNIPEPQPTGNTLLDLNLRKQWLDARREYLIQLAREQAKEQADHDTVSTYRFFYIHWIAGYLTAVNIKTDDTFDILGTSDIDAAILWIKNYCSNNPFKSLSYAVDIFVKEFYPYRTSKASDAIIAKEEPVNNAKIQGSHSLTSRPSVSKKRK